VERPGARQAAPRDSVGQGLARAWTARLGLVLGNLVYVKLEPVELESTGLRLWVLAPFLELAVLRSEPLESESTAALPAEELLVTLKSTPALVVSVP
jgi:hypothetical protein